MTILDPSCPLVAKPPRTRVLNLVSGYGRTVRGYGRTPTAVATGTKFKYCRLERLPYIQLYALHVVGGNCFEDF